MPLISKYPKRKHRKQSVGLIQLIGQLHPNDQHLNGNKFNRIASAECNSTLTCQKTFQLLSLHFFISSWDLAPLHSQSTLLSSSTPCIHKLCSSILSTSWCTDAIMSSNPYMHHNNYPSSLGIHNSPQTCRAPPF